MSEPAVKKSDLGTRALSAVVMLAVAGTALWFGGWLWAGFVGLVGIGVFIEWIRLALRFNRSATARIAWICGGVFYLGLALMILVDTRVPLQNLVRPPSVGVVSDDWRLSKLQELSGILPIILAVIAVDVGAYFAGRAIGGPKIAPRISPSKTWAGLGGGMVMACLTLMLWHWFIGLILCGAEGCPSDTSFVVPLLVAGIVFAVVAQAGDFFESWMKRRAGVKDSGILLPGHGGLFDRTDGLIAVSFVIGLLALLTDAFFDGPF